MAVQLLVYLHIVTYWFFFGLLRYATQRARDFKDIKDISIRWNVYPAYFPEQ